MVRLVESFEEFVEDEYSHIDEYTSLIPKLDRYKPTQEISKDYFRFNVDVEDTDPIINEAISLIKNWFYENANIDSSIGWCATSKDITINEDLTVSLEILSLNYKDIKDFIDIKECENFCFYGARITKLPELPKNLEKLDLSFSKVRLIDDSTVIPNTLNTITVPKECSITNKTINEYFKPRTGKYAMKWTTYDRVSGKRTTMDKVKSFIGKMREEK